MKLSHAVSAISFAGMVGLTAVFSAFIGLEHLAAFAAKSKLASVASKDWARGLFLFMGFPILVPYVVLSFLNQQMRKCCCCFSSV